MRYLWHLSYLKNMDSAGASSYPCPLKSPRLFSIYPHAQKTGVRLLPTNGNTKFAIQKTPASYPALLAFPRSADGASLVIGSLGTHARKRMHGLALASPRAMPLTAAPPVY